MASDPGTDLPEWASLDWQVTDGPVRVTTTGLADGHTIPLQPLVDFASNWAGPKATRSSPGIDIDPRHVCRVGRGGALVDALPADPEAAVTDRHAPQRLRHRRVVVHGERHVIRTCLELDKHNPSDTAGSRDTRATAGAQST